MDNTTKKKTRKISFIGFRSSSDESNLQKSSDFDRVTQYDSEKSEVKLDDEMDKVFNSYEFPEILPKNFSMRKQNVVFQKQLTAPDCLITIPDTENSFESKCDRDNSESEVNRFSQKLCQFIQPETENGQSAQDVRDGNNELAEEHVKKVHFTIGSSENNSDSSIRNKLSYQKFRNRRFYRNHHSNNRQYYYSNRLRKLSLQDEIKSSYHSSDEQQVKHKRRSSSGGSGRSEASGSGSSGSDKEKRNDSGAANVVSDDIENGDTVILEEHDIDSISSHRLDPQKSSSRFQKMPTAPFVALAGKAINNIGNVLSVYKKIYDHSPHEVFVQLDELSGVGEDREWRETARWIKYEEDYEEGAERWGKPHVASLSFHSLLNLRRCLETGVVLLDLEEKDLPGIAYQVTEQMVGDELISESDKITVLKALLLKHRHVEEHHYDRSFLFSSKRPASYTSLMNIHEAERKRSTQMNMNALRKNGSMLEQTQKQQPQQQKQQQQQQQQSQSKEKTKPDENEANAVDYSSSIEDIKKTLNETILRRIPTGAEATTVLVGCVDFLKQTTIAFVRLATGIYLPQITEVPIPVRFMFILMGPKTPKLDYHEIGRSIATLMSNKQFHDIAYKADDRKALLSGINEFLDESIVLPPGDWEQETLLPFEELKAKSEAIRKRKEDALRSTKKAAFMPVSSAIGSAKDATDDRDPHDNPLKRTKRPFGGLINDVRRRFPFYISDFTDGLNVQCLAAAIFMFFAALSGAITFGGLMSDKTANLIGVSETLVITSLAGVIFGLFSGQPMVIVGTTGPLLLFDESLNQLCRQNGIDYLGFRIFVGLWLGVISLVVASVEGSVFIKQITRFTEDIFSALISLLYIYESLLKVISVFHNHPILENYGDTTGINGSTAPADPLYVQNKHLNQPNTALFCTILALGTFIIAYYLRLFRNSKFLGRDTRRMLGDFGVPIAIVTMVFLSNLVPQAYTDKLIVPDGLTPSNSAIRGWFISPTREQWPLWLIIAAAVPAMLIYILLFMETHISELIIDKKERRLKKGSGFHLDIVIICLINVLSGFMGAPWICAATVRSISHVSALTVMSRTHAPGQKPHIVNVKEQRVSALTVAVLIGASVAMAPLLRRVPMAILFGVFLYMGVSSTNGIQLFERIKLLFMPIKHYPQTVYVRKVQTMKIHLFTLVQILCFALLWIVKSTKISLAFPFFLLLMIPIRYQLRHIFKPEELRALDGDQLDDEDDDEVDIYVKAPLPG